MRVKRLADALLCLVGLGSTVVSAADLSGPKYEPPPAYPDRPVYAPIWTGLYAGISGGYGWGDSTQSYDRNDNHGIASTSPEGGLAALTLGYNYQLPGGLVLGAEADLGFMDVSADDKEVYDGHIYKTSFGPWWGTVRGRAGLALGPTLIYATGGLAFMGVDEVSIGNTPGETAYNKDWRSGWVVGGGIEHAFTNTISAKVEYLHMDFGKYSGLSDNREDFSFENSVDVVRVGLNTKF